MRKISSSIIEFLPKNIRRLEASSIQKALENISNKEIISFALGMPSEILFPISPYKGVLSEIWEQHVLQYSPPLEILKYQIIEIMKLRGVRCCPSEICLTNGAQQAIFLLIKLLTEKNDLAIADRATYPGFIQAANLLGIKLFPLEANAADELDLNTIEKVFSQKKTPKFFYTIPEGHNPLGTSFNEQERSKLVDIAFKYGIPIIEDDPYGFINYKLAEPSLKSYSKGLVLYIGSFSKIFVPSVRVGWVVAPTPIIEKLEILKASIDVNTSTFSQKIVSTFLEKEDFSHHLIQLRTYYAEKRDAMINALRKYIPQLSFTVPTSGFFIWGKLPLNFNAEKLFLSAFENNKVAFLPGSVFKVAPYDSSSSVKHCFRLSFSHCPKELIEEGVKRLANAINTYRT